METMDEASGHLQVSPGALVVGFWRGVTGGAANCEFYATPSLLLLASK